MRAMAENFSYVHPNDLHDRATCTCVRCTGFQPGNQINLGRSTPRDDLVRHGAHRSPLVLAPEAEKIADLVRPLMPVPHPSFEGTLQSYCITLTRIQKAHDALEEVERRQAEDPDFVPDFNHITLGDYLMRWQSSARKDAQALGLTPESAVKILKDAQIGNLAASMALTQEKARQVPAPALEKMRAAMLEALEEPDVIDQ